MVFDEPASEASQHLLVFPPVLILAVDGWRNLIITCHALAL